MTTLDHLALGQNKHLVTGQSSIKPVRNAHHRDPPLLNGIKNPSLTEVVEGTGGFVEQQNRRSADQGPADFQALPFATTEITTVVAQLPLKGIGMTSHGLQELGISRGFLQILIGVLGVPKRDVVGNGGCLLYTSPSPRD